MALTFKVKGPNESTELSENDKQELESHFAAIGRLMKKTGFNHLEVDSADSRPITKASITADLNE
jgi:hypothetical protein